MYDSDEIEDSGIAFDSRITADITLRAMPGSPYSPSRFHNEPAYENEDKAAYDLRTFRSH